MQVGEQSDWDLDGILDDRIMDRKVAVDSKFFDPFPALRHFSTFGLMATPFLEALDPTHRLDHKCPCLSLKSMTLHDATGYSRSRVVEMLTNRHHGSDVPITPPVFRQHAHMLTIQLSDPLDTSL